MGRMIVRFLKNSRGDEDFELDSNQHGANNPAACLTLNDTSPTISAMKQLAPQPGVVEAAGTDLMNQLCSQLDVNRELSKVLNDGSASSLYMLFEGGIVEAPKLPWESLFDKNREFLALDSRWPIGRMKKTVQPPPVHSLISVDPVSKPLFKILAVLSAQGLCHLDEWEALFQAKQRAMNTNAPFEVALSVVVSSNNLEGHIRKQDPQTTVIRLPKGKVSEIQTAIYNHKPHVIHFFCHGTDSYLEIADDADYIHGSKRGSIHMYPNDILQPVIRSKCDTWLVMLNCCDSASSTNDTRSLAHNLVSETIPVIVGMREPIDRRDASELTQSFYSSLVDEVTSTQKSATPTVELEWSNIFGLPRSNIRERSSGGNTTTAAAAEYKEWTLPALYTIYKPFLVKSSSSTAESQGASQATQQVTNQVVPIPDIPTKVVQALKSLEESYE